ncbi:class I SAM-dependent methyltransferase [Bradyrhizobium sp.]|uniref:class I SAM-dependent methyltransferase n=1 Tax=Bradyrhizobium sp. TaxID=376 RepID=UPI000A7B51A4|nr:class I SAM-dependent methyltransferase [Bradyrhizobium sp.]
MTDATRKSHWETVYTTKKENEVSWFQENPAPSLELIDLARPTPTSTIVDIGGGASRLVDSLVARGFNRMTVLDISEAALEAAKARLGERASQVEWIVADVTTWRPAHRFDIWHDRAAFHFLINAADRSAYVTCMKQAVEPGGHVIIGTFALDGPEKCSGLPVNRYDAASLTKELGEGLELVDSRRHDHSTPWKSAQRFQFCMFRRTA